MLPFVAFISAKFTKPALLAIYMRIVLAMEAREGPNTSRQSRASHGDDWPPLQGDDGHLSSTWYCWQGGWQIIQHPVGLPSVLEEMWCGTSPAECSSAEKRIRIVLVLEAHEGPNA